MTPTPAKPSRWKRLGQNVALSLGTVVLCIAALEIVLRLNHYGNLEIYEPDPELYWKLKPNQDCYTKVDRKPVHINSLGTRGPEFQAAKATDTIRILSLGDSRTFGWGLSEAETYSTRLQRLLEQRLGGTRKVEVINAGVNAWSYPQMLVYFRKAGVRYQPDVVLLAEANLWTQFSEESSPEFVRKFMFRVRLKNFLRRFAIYHYVVEVKLKAFYERNRSKFIPVDPGQDPWFKAEQQKDPEAAFRGAIHNLCALASRKGIKPVLIHLPTFDELISTNPPVVLKVKREVSQELGVPLVEMGPVLRAQPGGTSRSPGEARALYLEGDPVHFTSHGNEVIAQQLFEAVLPLTTAGAPAGAGNPP